MIQATDNNFCGTTRVGGASGYGTALKMDASGNFTTLHCFASGDRASSCAGLIQATDENFRGTTMCGRPAPPRLARADPTSAITETNESSNTASKAITITP